MRQMYPIRRSRLDALTDSATIPNIGDISALLKSAEAVADVIKKAPRVNVGTDPLAAVADFTRVLNEDIFRFRNDKGGGVYALIKVDDDD